jgi:hypothetical protein
MPRRRRGASVSEHIDKSLTANRVGLFTKVLNFMHFGNCYERGNENVTIPKSVLKIGFKIDPIEVD